MVMSSDSSTGNLERVEVQRLYDWLYFPHKWDKCELVSTSQHIKASFISPQGRRIDVVEENIVVSATRIVHRESPVEYKLIEAEGANARLYSLYKWDKCELVSASQHIKASFISPQGRRIDVVEENIVVSATRIVYRESPAEYKLIEAEGANTAVDPDNKK